MKDKKAMTKRELVGEISEVTHLKPIIVQSVIDAFSDIMIREAVVNEKFRLSNCFSIDTYKKKERTQYNVNKGKYERYPETNVLNIKLSKKIHDFHKWKQRHEYNEEHGLTVEDWKNREGPEIPK